VTLFGRVPTTKESIWLIGTRSLLLSILVVWVSVRLEKPTLVSLVNWCGTWSSHQTNYGCNFYQINTLGGWNFLQASIQTNSSPSWSSIIRAKNILNHGYSWRAGLGSSSFWFSNWSTHGPIGNHIPIIDIHDLRLTVKDVFSVDGLHAQKLYTNLPPESVDFINSTHFRFNTAIEDSSIWARNKNGNYKSGYDWLLSLSKLQLMTPLPTDLGPGYGGYKHQKNSNF